MQTPVAGGQGEMGTSFIVVQTPSVYDSCLVIKTRGLKWHLNFLRGVRSDNSALISSALTSFQATRMSRSKGYGKLVISSSDAIRLVIRRGCESIGVALHEDIKFKPGLMETENYLHYLSLQSPLRGTISQKTPFLSIINTFGASNPTTRPSLKAKILPKAATVLSRWAMAIIVQSWKHSRMLRWVRFVGGFIYA